MSERLPGAGRPVIGGQRLHAGLRWTAAAATVVALASSWLALLKAARQALYFEPTTEALARAADGRRSGVAAALVLVASALLLAVATRRAWLALLAIPGVVTGTALSAAPQAAAVVFDLLATAITLVLVLVIAVVSRGRSGP